MSERATVPRCTCGSRMTRRYAQRGPRGGVRWVGDCWRCPDCGAMVGDGQ